MDSSVILFDKTQNQAVVSVYVRGNEQAAVNGIPDGDYKVYCAYGSDWDGSTFNKDVRRRAFVESFPFTTTPRESTIWEVTIQTQDGNTPVENVQAEDFPGAVSSIEGQ